MSGFDMSEFQAALREYLPKVPHSLAETLNKKLLYINRGALRDTPKAERSTIETDLGVSGYNVSISRKTGKFTRRKALIFGDRISRIINSLRLKAGLKPLTGNLLEAAKRKFLGRRIRAIGSLKAGWVGAIRKLSSVTGDNSGSAGLPRVKQGGKATPAKDEWSPEASSEYFVTEKRIGGNIDPRVVEALGSSFRAEMQSMNDFIVKRLQKDADKINAK